MTDYAKGFKDGFAAGLEEGKKLKTPQIGWPSTEPYSNLRETCPKCGVKISGAMGYVCYSPNCPTYPNVTSGPGNYASGAVGSKTDYTVTSTGANGPGGPYDGPEYHNKVWINGVWCDLGN